MKKPLKFIATVAIIILIFLCFTACDKNEKKQGFLVAFEANGGQPIKSYYTDSIEDLPLTTKDGYYLDGWYTDKQYTNQVVFPLEIMKDTTLYARWITLQSGSPNLVYQINEEDDTYEIIGYIGKSQNVIIPQTYDDKDITRIADGAFNLCHTVTKIYIPDCVIDIGRAFDRCNNLNEIIVSPNSFYYTTENGILYSKDKTQLISYPPNKEGDTYTIPQTVTTIENSAIRFCNNLKRIVISKNVQKIEKYFEGCQGLEEITVDEDNQIYKSINGVLYTKDGKSLLRFPHNYADRTFDVPVGVKKIDAYAFNQSEIEVLNISASVKEIPTFEGCRNLSEINVSQSNTEYQAIAGVLFDKEFRTLLQYPQARVGEVYNNEDDEKDYYEYCIPSGTEVISNWAFNSCTKLNRIIIPSSTKDISEYAFTNLEGNFQLYEIVFDDGSNLENIGDNAFLDCPLKVLTLTAILPPLTGSDIFSGVDAGFIINVPADTINLYKSSFWNNYEATLTAGDYARTFKVSFNTSGGMSIEDLYTAYISNEIVPQREDYIFGGWYIASTFDGDKVQFPFVVDKDINLYAKWYSDAEGTEGLTFSLQSSTDTYRVTGYNGKEEKIYLPSTYNGKLVTAIGDNAFSEKTFIRKVFLAETINSIGNYAFAGNSNNLMHLESVVFSDTELQSIGSYAFRYCVLLREINLPETLKIIGNGAFSNCTLLNDIYIPKKVESIAAYAFSNCNSLSAIEVDPQNEYYITHKGVLYNKNKTILIKYPAAKQDEVFAVPNTVESIATEAFYAAYNIKNVIFSDNLTEIGTRAFHYCSSLESAILPSLITIFNPSVFRNTQIKSITLSEGVEILQDNFNSLYGLENIFVNGNNNFYKSIEGALYSYDQKTLIRCPIAKKGEYVFPSNVERIASQAFYECQIESVTFNEELQEIASQSFYKCNNLTKINFNENLNYIDDDAFMYASNLKFVNISSQNHYPELGVNVFAGTNNNVEPITVFAPEMLLNTLNNDNKWNIFEITSNSVIVDNMHLQLVYDEYYKLIKHLSDNEEITIPSTVNGKEIREIAQYAFNGKVKRINLSSAIRLVKNYAFTTGNESKLTTVVFEGNSQLYSISTNAFYKCNRLTSIVINTDSPPSIAYESSLNEIKDFVTIYVPDINSYDNTPYMQFALRNISSIEDDFVYTDTQEGIIINGYIGADTTITIPTVIKRKSVIAIGSYAISSIIEKVILQDSIKYIYDDAFSAKIYNRDFGFFELKEIEMSANSLLTIGKRAFEGTAITNINIPPAVNSISVTAFKDCNQLKSIYVDAGNGSYRSIGGVLFDKVASKIIKYPAAKINSEYTLPLTTLIVGEFAFERAEHLVKINLNDNLQNINSFAFSECKRLLDINLPNGLLKVDSFAFKGCSRLLRLDLPVNITEFNSSAVVDCNLLTIIYVNDVNESFYSSDGALFDKEMIRLISFPAAREGNYELPSTVQYIEPYAFYGSNLNSVTLSENIQQIGAYAFARNNKLTTININSPLTTLAEGMLFECVSLQSLNIPDTVTVISDSFAEGCINLQNLTLSQNLQTLGKRAFARCSKLNQLSLPQNLLSIGERAFYNCINVTNVILPNSLQEVGQGIFIGINDIYAISMGTKYQLNYLFGVENKSIPSSLKTVNINEGATLLPEGYFKDYESLQNVTLPSTLNTIKKEAFSNCASLQTVEIKGAYDTLSRIEECAFWNCYNLISIRLYNSIPAPNVHSTSFQGEYGGVNQTLELLYIYVPSSSIEAYKEVWGIENARSI